MGGIDREMGTVLGECIRISTDRATENEGIEPDNALRDGFQGIGRKLFLKQPGISVGRGFDGAHIVVDTLNGGAQNALGTLNGLLTDQVARPEIEEAQRYDKYRSGQEYDFKTEFPEKATTDFTHGSPPFR